jgi:hypothetical protein
LAKAYETRIKPDSKYMDSDSDWQESAWMMLCGRVRQFVKETPYIGLQIKS